MPKIMLAQSAKAYPLAPDVRKKTCVHTQSTYLNFVTQPLKNKMASREEEDDYEKPRKIPKTLKEKDSGKRLIVILERASLEAVKVRK